VPASDPKKPSWLERLFEAAEQARKQSELGGDKTRPGGPSTQRGRVRGGSRSEDGGLGPRCRPLFSVLGAARPRARVPSGRGG